MWDDDGEGFGDYYASVIHVPPIRSLKRNFERSGGGLPCQVINSRARKGPFRSCSSGGVGGLWWTVVLALCVRRSAAFTWPHESSP